MACLWISFLSTKKANFQNIYWWFTCFVCQNLLLSFYFWVDLFWFLIHFHRIHHKNCNVCHLLYQQEYFQLINSFHSLLLKGLLFCMIFGLIFKWFFNFLILIHSYTSINVLTYRKLLSIYVLIIELRTFNSFLR